MWAIEKASWPSERTLFEQNVGAVDDGGYVRGPREAARAVGAGARGTLRARQADQIADADTAEGLRARPRSAFRHLASLVRFWDWQRLLMLSGGHRSSRV